MRTKKSKNFIGRVIACGLTYLCVGSGAQAQTAYAVGNWLQTGTSELFRIEDFTTNPTAVGIGNTGLQLGDIAIAPDGMAYGVAAPQQGSSDLYSLNLSTGVASLVGSLGVGTQDSLDAASNSLLYSMGFGDTHLYAVSAITGQATAVADTGFEAAGDVVVSPDGRTLYGTSTTNELFSVNLSTDKTTAIGPLDTTTIVGLGFIDGTLYGLGGAVSSFRDDEFTIDTLTGHATYLGAVNGSGTYGVYGLAIQTVPEPATCIAVGCGLVGALVRRRRVGRS